MKHVAQLHACTHDWFVLLSGNRLALRQQKSLRYSPNRHMLVFRGIKERENHESTNQASGIWSSILLSGSRRQRVCGVFRVIAVALAAIVGGAVPCSAAGLMIEAPNLTATPGSSGSFDLLLVNTNPTGGTSYDVSSDQFVLSLSGPLGITFTGVSIATDPVAAPYIFVSSGTTQPGGPPLSTDTFPNTTFTGADTEFATSGLPNSEPGRDLRPRSRFLRGELLHPQRHRHDHDRPIPCQLAHGSGRQPDLFRDHQWLDRGRMFPNPGR